jgi:hypothetical protein
MTGSFNGMGTIIILAGIVLMILAKGSILAALGLVVTIAGVLLLWRAKQRRA